MKMETKTVDEGKKILADALSVLLASTYSLYLKTQYCHWNVTGRDFYSLHLLFEAQYGELALAVDLIAERIRALGFVAPGSYRAFAELSEVQDSEGVMTAAEMVAALARDHDTVIRIARTLGGTAEKCADLATADLVTVRMAEHEKAVWMLRSLSA